MAPIRRLKPQGVIERVLSGGQTGVDRAALDAALASGLAIGGWCPKGRRAEDGAIPDRYPLLETESAEYDDRTRRNVRDSDATLIVTGDRLSGGTELTLLAALAAGKPCLVVDLRRATAETEVLAWLDAHQVSQLNVAGPRESGQPGIYRRAFDYLYRVLGRTSD